MHAPDAGQATTATAAPDAMRPPALRRAWFFVPGMQGDAHAVALRSGADALVVDLEEMTRLEDRPEARRRIVTLMSEARAHRMLGAVRINKLEEDGLDDLEGVMPGAPSAIFLPHSERADQLSRLDAALTSIETRLGLPVGTTEIVPTIESAKGLVALGALLGASARIRCGMLAVEDLANNLGARRTRDGQELLYARSRFLIECIAAGCTPIDLPCTYRSEEAIVADMALSTQLGFTSKCVVFADQVRHVNDALTPSDAALQEAQQTIAAYARQSQGDTASGWIDAPERNNALRLIARHQAFNIAA